MKTSLILAAALLLSIRPLAAETQASELAHAARAVLDSLDADQRGLVMHESSDDARFDWHFIPKSGRKGLPIKEMEPDQAESTHALLRAALSASGYGKAEAIMELEGLLGEIEHARGRANALDVRDPEKYYLSLFGEPSAGGDWALSFEGHHLSLNFTIAGGQVVASTPAFFAANPHRVGSGPREGLRVLADEEDAARRLLRSLDADQRQQAVIAASAPRDILTGAKPRVSPFEPEGLPAGSMNDEQFGLLQDLIGVYAGNVSGEALRERLGQIETAGRDIHFAWMGSPDPGEAHYYRVQAPTFLIEYDNIQNGANHSHTVWRDFDGDFGRDVIAEHHAATPY